MIITAVDEHLYHPAGLGRYLRSQGAGASRQCRHSHSRWSPMCSRRQRNIWQELVDMAFPWITTTSSVSSIPMRWRNSLSVGRHWAAPEGHIRYPKQDQLLLFHYKFLGIDYLLRRYALLSSGLGATDKEHRWGYQYDLGRDVLEVQFAELRRTAVDATSAQAQKVIREKWWRPA